MCNPTRSALQRRRALAAPVRSPATRPAPRGQWAIPVACLFALVAAAGCASTKVTDRQQLVTEQLPRPATVWVQDFAATPADLPADSALAGQVTADAAAQSAEHVAAGRELGAQIAADLVEQIRGMGMSAERAVPGKAPQINDLVIRGYLLSFEEGSAKKRVGIGFGSGASQLSAAVEGFQVTAQGLRKLGAGATESGGGKTPGAAMGAAVFLATSNPVGLVVSGGMKLHEEKTGSGKVEGRAKQTAKEIAEVLQKRFQEQGWIK